MTSLCCTRQVEHPSKAIALGDDVLCVWTTTALVLTLWWIYYTTWSHCRELKLKSWLKIWYENEKSCHIWAHISYAANSTGPNPSHRGILLSLALLYCLLWDGWEGEYFLTAFHLIILDSYCSMLFFSCRVFSAGSDYGCLFPLTCAWI